MRKDMPVPMREDCKHYQSRTYQTGEVARWCSLDLAPEAPWRCPDSCPGYEVRLAEAGWIHGSMVEPKVEDEPDLDSASVADLLGAAEAVVEEVTPEVLAETRAAQERSRRPWWRRLRR
jgi:hypothetical protein